MERIHRIVFVVVLVMATLAGSVTAVKAGNIDGNIFELIFDSRNNNLPLIPPTSFQNNVDWHDVNFTLESNANLIPVVGSLNLNFDYAKCTHEKNPYICPPGVKPGSTSLRYNSQGQAVFPAAIGEGTIAVDPAQLKPYPEPVPGIMGGDFVPMHPSSQAAPSQTTYNKVTFRNVLFYNTGKTQNITISGLSFDDNALFNKYPGTNPSIWLTASVSPTTGLTVNNPQFPYAVLTNYTPACDESFVSITPGYPTYIRARNIAFNGNLYDVDMPVVTLPDGSLGFSVLAVRQGSNCPNTGNSLSQAFVLTLSKVNVNGTDYWAQLQWTGSAFKLLSAH